MKQNRKWSALKLKRQFVYSQFDEAPRVRYKSVSCVREWLDIWEHPSWYKRSRWGHSCWKRQRKTQYKLKNQLHNS